MAALSSCLELDIETILFVAKDVFVEMFTKIELE